MPWRAPTEAHGVGWELAPSRARLRQQPALSVGKLVADSNPGQRGHSETDRHLHSKVSAIRPQAKQEQFESVLAITTTTGLQPEANRRQTTLTTALQAVARRRQTTSTTGPTELAGGAGVLRPPKVVFRGIWTVSKQESVSSASKPFTGYIVNSGLPKGPSGRFYAARRFY